MSLKSIDQSLAVHKITDAGMVQRELQQKPVMDQAALAQTAMKTAELNRKRSEKLEQPDKSQVRNSRDGNNGGGKGGKNVKSRNLGDAGSEPNRKAEEHAHPFKGHHIDLSL